VTQYLYTTTHEPLPPAVRTRAGERATLWKSRGSIPSLGGEALAARRPANRGPNPEGLILPKPSTRSVRVQPRGDSYFLPGKVAGRAVTFLLDSRCATNLLSRRVFDTLPPKDKAGMEPYTEEHGTLVDRSCIPFYGIIELTGHVRDQAIRETFIVSQLEKDAIFGMPFLK